MSILDRLEEIRINERLKKKDFEEILGKSSGYIGTLKKSGGAPGSDVLIKLSDYFRKKYNLDWILTGEGKMLKNEYSSKEENYNIPNLEDEKISLQNFQVAIQRDLQALSEGMTHNFEVVSNGLIASLQGQRKILDFIEKLNAEEISKATSKLDELLKQQK